MNEESVASNIANHGVLLTVHYPQWVKGLIFYDRKKSHPKISTPIAHEIRKKVKDVITRSLWHSYDIPEGRFMPLSMLDSWKNVESELNSWSSFIREGCAKFRNEIVNNVLLGSEPDAIKEWQLLYPTDGGKPPRPFSMDYCRKEARKVPSKPDMLSLDYCFSTLSPHPLLLQSEGVSEICREFSAGRRTQMAYDLILEVPVAYACMCQKFCKDIVDNKDEIFKKMRLRTAFVNKVKRLSLMDTLQDAETQSLFSKIKVNLDKDGSEKIEYTTLAESVHRLLSLSLEKGSVQGFIKWSEKQNDMA